MPLQCNILVIDDEPEIRELISSTARGMGHPCIVAHDAASFLENLTPATTLILLDLVMPGMDGIELLRLIAQRNCTAGIVLMSGVGRRVMETAAELAAVHGLSIVGHLQKPFRILELETMIHQFSGPLPTVRIAQCPEIVFQEDDLRQAILRDEFILHYQPQVDILTGQVIGVEALARWIHPVRGLISPACFIPQFERLQLMDGLGWLVLLRGLSELPLFAAPDGRLPQLSVNVSVQTLHNLRFPDEIVDLMQQHNIPVDRLVLEITETGILQELTCALDVLTRLRMKQINLSIDDFGTGYAMMQQLKLIPATELKIDRYFVGNMLTNKSSRILVLKTIEISHELGMKVVAEGVETPEQLAFLRSNGCDIAQGYLFSRPLPPADMQRWLRGAALPVPVLAAPAFLEGDASAHLFCART